MARNKNDVIVIPWDYSEESDIALQHGVQLAKEVNNQIMIARFLEAPGMFAGKAKKDQLIADEKEKLKEVGKKVSEKYKINPFVAVELGSSSAQFSKLTREAKANLVILGQNYRLTDKITYGSMDMVKRLNRLDIPFVVTHQPPAHNYYKEIVVPLDHDKKYKETLHWVIYLSKYYNCNINIIKPYIEDELKKKDMSNNIYFTKKLLDKKNIIYGIKTAKKKRVFEEEVLRFAENIDSDLIVMMVNKFQGFLNDNPDYDKKIPIMVINRNSQIIKYGGSFR